MTLADYFGREDTYAAMYESYRGRGVDLTIDADDIENDVDTPAKLERYVHVGADALRIVVNALIANRREPPTSVLDFPSGSGRVTRHLAAFFPTATHVVGDLYDSHVEFCTRTFGARGVVTGANPDDVDFGHTFDVIFCGSLLTHLPEPQVHPILRLITRSLSPRGIAIVTLHGRASDVIQHREPDKYAPDSIYERARRQVAKRGFGYADYEDSFRSRFFKQRSYGVALVRPHWVVDRIAQLPGVRLLGYTEMDWDGHQDVAVFGRPDVTS